MRHPILSLLLLCCVTTWAQRQNVSGTVKGPDGGIAKVSVREIDSSLRVFNHTKTDRNGLFSFQVRDAQHSLQFYAPGYRTLTHKMLGEKSFRVTMEKRRTSPYVAKAKVILKSDRLFNGHYMGEVVRQQAWIEKMTDSLYSIIIPIEMERPVDEYPIGRQLIILDDLDRQVLQLENLVDAYPIPGSPDEIDQSSIVQTNLGIESGDGDTYIPGGSEGSEKLYAYPHFKITRFQLERFCENPTLLGRIAVDNYRANNYWNLFPTDKTISLFRKALDKDVKKKK